MRGELGGEQTSNTIGSSSSEQDFVLASLRPILNKSLVGEYTPLVSLVSSLLLRGKGDGGFNPARHGPCLVGRGGCVWAQNLLARPTEFSDATVLEGPNMSQGSRGEQVHRITSCTICHHRSHNITHIIILNHTHHFPSQTREAFRVA